MKPLLAALLLLLTVSSGICSFKTGNDLAEEWREYKKYRDGLDHSVVNSSLYMGYVTGVADANDEVFFSIPVDTTVKQLCLIVGKFLDDNPTEWTSTADFLITRALVEAYGRKK